MEMNAYVFALDVLKFIISGVVVVYALYYFFRQYFERNLNQRLLQIRVKETETILPLQLQAYERLILFVERINPENILIRLHAPELTAQQLQMLVVTEIRAEYQHNITQQLYINSHIWQMVRKLKDDTILMVNNASKGLGENCDATTFSKTILSHIDTIAENPYQNMLNLIKEEIQQFF